MSSLSPRRNCHHFSLAEIKDATNDFDKSKVLGQGGEAMVYLADLYIGSEKARVAVKRLKPNCNEFEKEIHTMSTIQHPHLVSLLGYSEKSDERILVYEYMAKGSLFMNLYKKSNISLSWQERLNICLDAARGLQFLHNETEEFPKGIIHRDVKPENILLDDKWVAKVSDFGMFKLSHSGQRNSSMTTNLKGTSGYYAPEYLRHGQITRKIDVYAFGVVLFEVLCRKMPWDRGNESYYGTDNEDLGLWAQKNVDTRIKGEISPESLFAFTDIIGRSLQADPRKRPNMNSVVLSLDMALKRQEHEDEGRKLGGATMQSTSSSKSENEEEQNYVKKDDLELLWKLTEEKDGSPARKWIQMLDESNPFTRYQTWVRYPEAGKTDPSWYRFRMVYEDVTPEVMRDLLWDDDFRFTWDNYLSHAETLDKCPITGTMVVKWIRKFPYRSATEYVIGRRIWESGRSYYCVTKSVPYPSVPRGDKRRRAELYYSSWRIRAVKSKSGNGKLTSCEVVLFHHEDKEVDWDSTKFIDHHLMINTGLRAYKSYRAKGAPLSHCAFMARITTKVSSDQLRYLDSSSVNK